MWRDHRPALTATFRSFGASAHDIGIGRSVPWAEAADLIEIASQDTSTQLFAGLAGWSYPASRPDLFLLQAQLGEAAAGVMPWATRDGEIEQVTDEEIRAAHENLLAKIHFASEQVT